MVHAMGNTETPLAESNQPDAQGLVTEAGWNQDANDWRIFLRLGRAIEVKDASDTLAATDTTLSYPSGFKWITIVLVSGPFRHWAIATRLFERCIATPSRASMVPMRNATSAGREAYWPLGFCDAWVVTSWRRAVTLLIADSVRPRPLEERDGCLLLGLDAHAFGCDHAPLLARQKARSPQYAYVLEESGRLHGSCWGARVGS